VPTAWQKSHLEKEYAQTVAQAFRIVKFQRDHSPQNEVFWAVTLCVFYMDTDILEDAAASVFRVEVCRVRNWFCYTASLQERWSRGKVRICSLVQEKGNGTQA
jgi:hypothetical protein